MSKPSRDKDARRRKRVAGRQASQRTRSASESQAPPVLSTAHTWLTGIPGTSWESTGYDPDEKPWPRGGAYAVECVRKAGVSFAVFGNRYGPMFKGDTEFVWCLCEGCGQPFQYWGSFGYFIADDYDDEVLAETGSLETAAGPCPACGGAGLPMAPLETRLIDGLRSVGTSELFFEVAISLFLEEMKADLLEGRIDVKQASAALAQRDSRGLKRLSDWLEKRPVTAATVASLLGTIAVLVTTYAPSDDPAPKQGITDTQLVEIIDQVLTHYDQVNPPDQHQTQPRTSRWRKKDGQKRQQPPAG